MPPNLDSPQPPAAASTSSRRSRRRASSTAFSPVRRTAEGKLRAARVIEFIQRLTVPSGRGQGRPFKLCKFQKDFLRDVYEPQRNGQRVVRRAVLSISRKNGKSSLTAGIALAHLIGPEAIPNGQIFSAATDREQAAIVFKTAQQIVQLEPELASKIEIIPSTKTMVARPNGSIYRAISAEAGTKHGYSPSVVIYDELAQARNRDLYDVLDSSFGSRKEPLFCIISTQSNDPSHILSKLIDDGLSEIDPSIVCHLHAADEGCDLDDEEQWLKANPGLDVFRDREDLAAQIRKAQRLPAEEPKVRNLLLNQRIAPQSRLISRAEWSACVGEVELEDGEQVYLGLDLSSTTDLTALTMVTASDPARIQAFFWKPSDTLRDHSFRDFGAGDHRYLEWHSKGYLFASPGRAIDPAVIARFIADLYRRYNVLGLSYDRWRCDELLREFDRLGLAAYKDGEKGGGGLRLIPWGQGFRDMAGAIDALEVAIMERKLVHANVPIMNWSVSNAVAVTDPAGNRKIDKEKARMRVDGAVALAMAMGLRARDRGSAHAIDVTALIG